MDISNVEGRKMGATRGGKKRKKGASGAGLQGLTGTWVADQETQDSE